ncbi:MAG TPA: amidohydrolase [Devosiaceae bacterium]|nr:amidohydrolase [Devosiaceae bacterium]
MAIIDTHLHLVYLDKFSYPWLSEEPTINRQWPVDEYFAQAESLGIDTALHMEVDVDETDIEGETRFMTKVHPRVIGAIAGGRPEYPDFADWLQTLAGIEGVRAVRRILHTMPDELSQAPEFAHNLRRLPAYNLGFDLCVRADQIMTVGLPLVQKCPDVQFVLDHCGVPDIAGAGLDPWRGHLREISRLPNVACKISGIIAYAGDKPTAATLQPYVEHVIECFGWDRVVWGSDYPVCTSAANLVEWVGITRKLIAGASAGEQAKLLSDNARRLYRI